MATSSRTYNAYEVHQLLDSSGEDSLMDDEPIMDGSDDEPDDLEIEEENYDDSLQQFIPSQHSTDSNSVFSSLLNISPQSSSPPVTEQSVQNKNSSPSLPPSPLEPTTTPSASNCLQPLATSTPTTSNLLNYKHGPLRTNATRYHQHSGLKTCTQL